MSKTYDSEIWKDIKGYEGLYQVSNMGRIRSLTRKIWCKCSYGGMHYRTYSGRLMRTTQIRSDKYQEVTLCVAGAMKQALVHRLVLETFVGPCPNNMECCHNNGIHSDNRLSNLRWDTYSGNACDRQKHGRTRFGEDHYRAVLKSREVRWIRRMYDSGDYSQQELADLFRVSKSTIAGITIGVTWKDVQ